MRTAFFLLLSVTFVLSNAQAPKFKTKYLNNISDSSLQQHVYILASDSLEGRGTATEGERKAAHYIVEQFKLNGLQPYNDTCFLQNIGLWSWQWHTFTLTDAHHTFETYQDFVYLSSAPIEPQITAKCVFIGNGSDSIINHIDLDGKIAFASIENFKSWYGIASKTKRKGAIAILMVHQSDSNAFNQVSEKFKAIHQQPSIGTQEPMFSSSMVKAFAVNQSLTEKLFNQPLDSLKHLTSHQQIKDLPTPKLTIGCQLKVELADANNVVGYLPGKGTNKAAVVISAHYDHIGERYNGICVGADDNASGTAAVIELAKAFAPLKGKLNKDLIFLCTSGEEKGLLGAFYFADHPQEHSFDIKANVNIDMIGRIDSTHKNNYIYTIGNNHYPEFDSLVHVANNMNVPLKIQYDYNKSQGFGNFLRLSDHYAFHRNNIPVLGFFSGLHNDYHTPDDTPDKIDYQLMEKRVKLIFTTTYLATQKTAFSSQTDE
ncbi:M28 family peptidase [Carboxylicivirga sp. A043]|uniref:M28 family metallopeptidase n=1 Tax=Carboxylicivirga litoralis TaxID=2816963 RepID=UPI0021CB9347|nr:M28 family peptidase [Carboxylicivirga sp. A043]MCU4155067.1 M28 family peptidase [Carboxylicivirga sp. A043]